MQVNLGFGERKCFSEELASDKPVLVDFQAGAGLSDMDIDLFVTDDRGVVVLHQSGLSHHKTTLDSPQKQLLLHRQHFQDEAQGPAVSTPGFHTYRFCVMHQALPGQVGAQEKRRITFAIRSANENAWKLARGEHTNNMHSHIQKLEDEVSDLMGKMDALREKERLLTMTNETTSRFLTRVSMLTSLFVMIVGMLQLELTEGVLRERKFIH